MKILKMYIYNSDSHEVGARNLYKIWSFGMKIYTFYKINKDNSTILITTLT